MTSNTTIQQYSVAKVDYREAATPKKIHNRTKDSTIVQYNSAVTYNKIFGHWNSYRRVQFMHAKTIIRQADFLTP